MNSNSSKFFEKDSLGITPLVKEGWDNVNHIINTKSDIAANKIIEYVEAESSSGEANLPSARVLMEELMGLRNMLLHQDVIACEIQGTIDSLKLKYNDVATAALKARSSSKIEQLKNISSPEIQQWLLYANITVADKGPKMGAS